MCARLAAAIAASMQNIYADADNDDQQFDESALCADLRKFYLSEIGADFDAAPDFAGITTKTQRADPEMHRFQDDPNETPMGP
eukprot:4243262-Pyramimonas_sp.AAC.1